MAFKKSLQLVCIGVAVLLTFSSPAIATPTEMHTNSGETQMNNTTTTQSVDIGRLLNNTYEFENATAQENSSQALFPAVTSTQTHPLWKTINWQLPYIVTLFILTIALAYRRETYNE